MNDFSYKDLRGMKDPETGEFMPITVYANSSDAYGVSSVFLNINTGYLMSFPPNVAGHGPYPMLFVLDNFHRMDKMPKFIDMVGMGRSQKVSFLIAIQDPAQINSIYSETDLDVLMTNCSIKIIKRTNNPTVTDRFSGMIAMRTQLSVKGYSYSENWFGRINKWAQNVNYQWKSGPIAGMAKGVITGGLGKSENRTLVQGFKNRPIKGFSPFCRKTSYLASKMELPKADFVNKEIIEQRDIGDRNPPLYVLFETSADKRNKLKVNFKK